MARFRSTTDPRAMDELVARFVGRAVTVARRLLSDPALAEDAAQETFLRLVRGAASYDPRHPFTHWFYAILRNTCRDLQRGRERQARALREGIRRPGCSAPADRGEVAELLRRLPDEERLVLQLRLQGDLSFEEIGILLGIHREAAKKRAQRGLRRLREHLGVPAAASPTY